MARVIKHHASHMASHVLVGREPPHDEHDHAHDLNIDLQRSCSSTRVLSTIESRKTRQIMHAIPYNLR
jgi:hypothetical protein